MTQYLITTFTDSTGQTFTEVTKARENQTFTVVLAESKEEAIKEYEQDKGWQDFIKTLTEETE
ncbi:DUF1381 domain-containing protein [Staphylococcus pseudintermedius]|uniref:DUF1381 domain-containing protein n=1 Tax=Staphylococcus pseudintermedius TaxID=283734 RepID=A0A8H9BVJ8_STAPS|nr:DUF1381 domain-containing protein [Staphylococcus pseudintermedius]EGQ0318563.1 DUF1381 domain-containing protein [Staphylococcus pseudintermedius]EGQ1283910.1 DUF1381 domain-containing protein [Staphylococcus pseudintermedius]EGQ2839699.1 DUF1381 domain-containing protein [Staphylococcus pseudintermedius]EGQ3464057.1 DUF1381 domain-containing protein [Staphylococcus pseudintermedius]EGQ4003763.1 DUF1381 domain-containing protein [Staphylococcus pseudintermedius]